MATLKRVQLANEEYIFLVGNEVRAMHQNARNLRDAVNDHPQVLDD